MAKARRLVYALPLLLCAALIFFFSFQSYDKQSLTPFLTQHVNKTELSRLLPDITIDYGVKHIHAKTSPFAFVEFLIRKGAHLTIYAALAALGYVALRPYPLRPGMRIMLVLTAVPLIAALDEWNQTFRAYRTGIYQDVILDTVGGTIGAALCALGFLIKDKRDEARHGRRKKYMG